MSIKFYFLLIAVNLFDNSLDPISVLIKMFYTREEKIRRRRLARYRLRALIRKVYLNYLWLSELEDLKLGDDAQKNITIILRRPTQQRGMLTIHDKRILNTKHIDRTEEEKIELLKLLDELPCFKNYPPVINLLSNFSTK
jgi:hypothetical protein